MDGTGPALTECGSDWDAAAYEAFVEVFPEVSAANLIPAGLEVGHSGQ